VCVVLADELDGTIIDSKNNALDARHATIMNVFDP
jgi:hypothetical protein